MRQGREVVAAGEVAARARHGDALGEAPSLENPVVRTRVAERGVPGAIQQPELREQRADPAAGVLAPASLSLVARAHVVVPDSMSDSRARCQLVAVPAYRRRLDLARRPVR